MYLYKPPFGSHTKLMEVLMLAAIWGKTHSGVMGMHLICFFFIFMLKYISFYFLQWSNNCHGHAPRFSHFRFAINIGLLVCCLFFIQCPRIDLYYRAVQGIHQVLKLPFGPECLLVIFEDIFFIMYCFFCVCWYIISEDI